MHTVKTDWVLLFPVIENHQNSAIAPFLQRFPPDKVFTVSKGKTVVM